MKLIKLQNTTQVRQTLNLVRRAGLSPSAVKFVGRTTLKMPARTLKAIETVHGDRLLTTVK